MACSVPEGRPAIWGKSTLLQSLSSGLRRTGGCWVLLLSLTSSATVAPADPVIAAHEAYRSHDLPALEKLGERAPGTLLGDYILFWSLEARLGTALRLAPASEVRAFLARADGPLPERLRADWLKALAQQQMWADLLLDGGAYAGSEPEILCGLDNARAARGDLNPPETLRTLWRSGRNTPAACEPVFARMLTAGRLDQDDLMQRFQRALETGNPALARSVAALLPPELGVADAEIARQQASPDAWLERLDARPRTPAVRLLELDALTQVARRLPARAASIWQHVAAGLPAGERGAGWARIAVQAAMQLDPEALADFRHAHDAALPDGELEWWSRAALRAGAWDEVLRATEQMSASAADKPAWRYWRARALKATGHREEAAQLFASVTHESEFYGQLALEELGQHPTLAAGARADAEEIAALRTRPAMQRALALFRLGLQAEAAQEWSFALRGASERQFLAAAEIARQAEWHDRMIAAAERAGSGADPALRYPLPFREALHTQARERGLDEAWIYGLIRQESRFLPDARSRTGASGLMQLMPATARWVARKIGMRDFKPARTEDVQTNLQLGSFYLRHVYDGLGQPVLATAAYNAGPGRVKRWLELRSLEGAIFCETIPLAETRDYVQKVMANTSLYSQRLGLPARTLKSRLGVVKGLSAAVSGDPDESDAALETAPPVPPRLAAPGAAAAPQVSAAGVPAPATAAAIPAVSDAVAPPAVIEPPIEFIPADP